MKIDCISDLHGETPILEGGDLLIIAGDLTASDQMVQYFQFNEWLFEQNLKYDEIILIAGNHDGLIQKKEFDTSNFHAVYLEDNGFEYKGLKIWGSPWTPTFGHWYFMKNRGDMIAEVWAKIPKDIDILVTHGPPFGILDRVGYGRRRRNGIRVGCENLSTASLDLNLKLHVFGHIHDGYGIKEIERNSGSGKTIYVNAAVLDEDYIMSREPITVIL